MVDRGSGEGDYVDGADSGGGLSRARPAACGAVRNSGPEHYLAPFPGVAGPAYPDIYHMLQVFTYQAHTGL